MSHHGSPMFQTIDSLRVAWVKKTFTDSDTVNECILAVLEEVVVDNKDGNYFVITRVGRGWKLLQMNRSTLFCTNIKKEAEIMSLAVQFARRLALFLCTVFGTTYTFESSFSHKNVIKTHPYLPYKQSPPPVSASCCRFP